MSFYIIQDVKVFIYGFACGFAVGSVLYILGSSLRTVVKTVKSMSQ